MWRERFALKFFAQNIQKKKNITKYLCYFHRSSVQDHLRQHYCTLEQLVGKTLIKIESAVAKQTKNVRFCFFQSILQAAIF